MLMLALTMAVFISAISVSAASGVRRTNVKATIAGSSNTALKIQWNKCSEADGYVIYRRESGQYLWNHIPVYYLWTSNEYIPLYRCDQGDSGSIR